MFRTSASILVVLSALASAPGQAPYLGNARGRLPAGQGPAVACLTVDLDGDGLLDLVRASPAAFGVFLQDGAGRYRQVNTGTPNFPGRTPGIVSLAAGRVTAASALPDVLVAYRDGTVLVHPNTGGGRFAPFWRLPAIAGSLYPAVAEILVGDLDLAANGLSEIVVTLNQERPVVFTVAGNNLFKQARLVGPTLVEPRSVLADLDGDRFPDLLSVAGVPGAPAAPAVWRNQRGVLALDTAAFDNTLRVASPRVLAASVLGGAVPEIVIAPAAATFAPLRVFRNTVSGGGLKYAPHTAASAFGLTRPRDVVLVDGDGDRLPDVFAIDGDGTVVFGRNDSAMPGSFTRARMLAGAAPHGRLCVADLEADGDVDIVVAGAGTEDRLFLGDGTVTGLADTDTETTGMPSGVLARGLYAVVDLTGEGDPDIAVWDRAGRGAMLHNAGGQARFERVTNSAVPTLPAGTYLDAQNASITGAGRHGDVVVLGLVSATNRTGVRVLVRRSSGQLVDETALRWQAGVVPVSMTVADVVGRAPGSAGAPGFSDVVGVDAAGRIVLVTNRKGTFPQASLVSPHTVSTDAQILVGDLDLDQLPDLVVIQPQARVRVLLANPRYPDTFDEIPPPVTVATRGLLEDLDGDLLPDLVLAVPSTSSSLQFWSGVGNGYFANQTAARMPRVGVLGTVSDLAAIRAADTAPKSIVVALAQELDRILVAQNRVFGAPQPLPLRGSVSTRSLLVHDLDLDGDDDLLCVRFDALPALLLGQTVQYTHTGGYTQVGRDSVLRVALPDAATLAAIGIGVPLVRFELPGLGVIRLGGIAALVPVPSPSPQLVHEIRVPIPAGIGVTPIPLQLITVDGRGALRFRNLDLWSPTGR